MLVCMLVYMCVSWGYVHEPKECTHGCISKYRIRCMCYTMKKHFHFFMYECVDIDLLCTRANMHICGCPRGCVVKE